MHFEIPADSPEKVAQFYEQLFGWKFNKMPGGDMDYWLISHKDSGENMDYWLISHKDSGENESMGGLYKKTMGETGFLNYFSVVNLDQALAKATDLGAKVVKGKQEIPNIGWFAILQDPDNNGFALFQGKM